MCFSSFDHVGIPLAATVSIATPDLAFNSPSLKPSFHSDSDISDVRYSRSVTSDIYILLTRTESALMQL